MIKANKNILKKFTDLILLMEKKDILFIREDYVFVSISHNDYKIKGTMPDINRLNELYKRSKQEILHVDAKLPIWKMTNPCGEVHLLPHVSAGIHTPIQAYKRRIIK